MIFLISYKNILYIIEINKETYLEKDRWNGEINIYYIDLNITMIIKVFMFFEEKQIIIYKVME